MYTHTTNFYGLCLNDLKTMSVACLVLTVVKEFHVDLGDRSDLLIFADC